MPSCCLLLPGRITPKPNSRDFSALHHEIDSFPLGYGAAEIFTGIASFDETTVFPGGQGPNLVADGCTYATNGDSIRWNGDGYFGMSTVTAMGNGPSFSLTYDVPTGNLSFTLQTFDGYPDSISVSVYDAGGALLSSTAGISVPDSTPVPFAYTSALAGSVVITGGGVLIGYSLTGAGPTNTPFGPVDMSAPITTLPTLTANASGIASMATGVPARASGFTVYTQAADLSGGLLSNSLAEVIL